MSNTTIQIKRSSVAGKVPNTSQLSIGELAINLADNILYASNGTGIFQIAPSVAQSGSPANNSTGSAGQIVVDNNYIYVCTATNTWKQAGLEDVFTNTDLTTYFESILTP
jgi:hypothetical protein